MSLYSHLTGDGPRMGQGMDIGAGLMPLTTFDDDILRVAAAVALEATLSFLGIGLPATEPSLGLLIANGFAYLYSGKYWISLFPGIALLITLVAINGLADGWREQQNPNRSRL